VFSGQPDNILRPLRQIISSVNGSFPYEDIVEEFKGKPKSFLFNEDEIENLFDYAYGNRYTFAALALLYPTLDFRNKFHVDHIHPKSAFTEKRLRRRGIPENQIQFYMENFNHLANLQLLEGTPNQEKNDNEFYDWLASKYPKQQDQRDFLRKNLIPDDDLDFEDFKSFIRNRRELLMNQYKTLLSK